jgi:hypothetical protein
VAVLPVRASTLFVQPAVMPIHVLPVPLATSLLPTVLPVLQVSSCTQMLLAILAAKLALYVLLAVVFQIALPARVDSPFLSAPPVGQDFIPSTATPADLAQLFLIVLPALVILFVPHARQATTLLFATAANLIITP